MPPQLLHVLCPCNTGAVGRMVLRGLDAEVEVLRRRMVVAKQRSAKHRLEKDVDELKQGLAQVCWLAEAP